jgi:hypothetical protein
LICPEGYFTPKTLEANFKRVLSSDRVFPRIFKSAGGNIDRVPAKERKQVLAVTAKMFVQRFVIENRHQLQVFCPSRSAPMKVDDWLIQSNAENVMALPENANDASAALNYLSSQHSLICQELWSVDYRPNESTINNLHKAEAKCLEKIDGWSLCFASQLLPDDFGQSMDAMAQSLAREIMQIGKARKGPGRPSIVTELAEALLEIFPDGTPNNPAKEIERVLNKHGFQSFSGSTLQKAITATRKSVVATG